MFFSECREIALVKNMQSNVDYRKLMKESGNLMDSILNKLDKDSKSWFFNWRKYKIKRPAWIFTAFIIKG